MKPRLSYSNVTASVALFLALGGTGYAATRLPRDSVGSAQIRPGAVTSSEVRDGSLLAADFGAGQLPAGPRGATGPQGERGLPGAPGPAGPGSVTPIPLLDLPNSAGGTLVDVPGVGALEARGCADLNVVLHYTNHSAAAQRWVLAGSFHARVNLPADTGLLAPGAWLDNTHNDRADVLRLSVSGPHPTTFEVSQSRSPAGHCLLWGQVVSA